METILSLYRFLEGDFFLISVLFRSNLELMYIKEYEQTAWIICSKPEMTTTVTIEQKHGGLGEVNIPAHETTTIF